MVNNKTFMLFMLILAVVGMSICVVAEKRIDEEEDRSTQQILSMMSHTNKKLTLLQRQARAYKELYQLSDAEAAKPVHLWR